MGSMGDTKIEAAMHEMATFNITQESEVQTKSCSLENHVYCVLG